MALRYEYPGGVEPGDIPLLEKFEVEILPYTMKHGSRIGAAAMDGNPVAEEVIRRQRLLVEGLPEMRATNFKMLVSALKAWEAAVPGSH